MRKLIILGTVSALAVPALAHGTPSHSPANTSAQAQCRTEQKAMGKQTFKDAYGTNKHKSNAFGKCVSHRVKQNAAAKTTALANAARSCKTERAADAAAFQAKYGTGKHGKNALGKCVSHTAKAKAHAAETAQVKAEENTAKTCKAERKADPAAFKAKYGTNRRKSNAFGKCVSATARAHASS